MSALRLALSAPTRLRATPRGARKPLLIALVVLTGLAGGYLWLRESSLVAVNDVAIVGLTGQGAAPARAALRDAALNMTTLRVREDQLRQATEPFPAIKEIRVESDFPHKLRIEVIEHVPVAAVEAGGRRVPVASDGTLLLGRLSAADLPVVPVSTPPGGDRLGEGRALAAVTILAEAPAELRPLIERVEAGRRGVVLGLQGGPELRFGTSARPKAKWAAASRVLADQAAAGATYIDVTAPERPVAGRFAPQLELTTNPGDPTPETTGGGADQTTPYSAPTAGTIAPEAATPEAGQGGSGANEDGTSAPQG